MSAAYFTIRYRSALHPDSVTLIVEDSAGDHFTLNCHPDHCRLTPLNDFEQMMPTLHHLGWHRVPEVAPYPLDALRSLMTGALATHHLPPFLEGAAHPS
jgi:hypothetical protein